MNDLHKLFICVFIQMYPHQCDGEEHPVLPLIMTHVIVAQRLISDKTPAQMWIFELMWLFYAVVTMQSTPYVDSLNK